MGTVELKSPEGAVSGYLALPKKRTGPGVLVLHAWWGLNEFFKSVCDRLATAGFVAFAPDLYHGAIASTRAEAENLMSKLEQTDLARKATGEEIVRGARGLQLRPEVRGKRLGVVGFSMGAFWSFWLAEQLPEDVAAVVVFYGTGGNYAKTQAAFLGHFAEKDEFEPAASVQDLEKVLRASGKDVTFHTYPGTMHWFFEDDRSDAYDAPAANLAWQRTVRFLTTQLSRKRVEG
jgi:carboxymethylenebutenolidase